MAESTLSLKYSDLQGRIARFLGYDADSLSADETADVDNAIQDGLRQFYYPPPVRGPVHEWSFLRPVLDFVAWPTVTGTVVGQPSYASPVSTVDVTAAGFYASMVGHNFTFDTNDIDYQIAGYATTKQITITGDASGETSDDAFTITADGDYLLPDDFGAIEGPITFGPNEAYHSIPVVGEVQIRRERQYGGIDAGTPQMAAIQPNEYGTTGQRFALLLWPTPNSEYNLTFRYNALASKLSGPDSYPLGGMVHTQTILASCLACAEHTMDDNQGIQKARFMELLTVSIAHDGKAVRAETLGYSRDAGSLGHCRGERRGYATHVLFDGVQY